MVLLSLPVKEPDAGGLALQHRRDLRVRLAALVRFLDGDRVVDQRQDVVVVGPECLLGVAHRRPEYPVRRVHVARRGQGQQPPGGDVVDGGRERGLAPHGYVFDLARNMVPGFENREFAGATFSPDGQTLFVNIQTPGLTLAIWGPWRKGSL